MKYSIRSLLGEHTLTSLAHNKKAKQVGALYSSLFFALILGVGISVINTRFLGPKHFGDYRFLMTLFDFIVPFLTLGVFVSGARLVAQKKNEDIKHQIMGSLLFLALAMSVVLMILVLIFSFFEEQLFHNDLGWVLRVFAPMLFVFPMQLCLGNIMQGDNRIYELSVFRIGPSLIYILGVLLFTLFAPLSLVPALAIRFLSIAVIVVLSVSVLKPAFRYFKATLAIIWQENKMYGFHVYIGVLAGVASGRLGGLSIGYFLDTTNVGFFSLASTITAPLMMIPNSVGTTFFKSFADRAKISTRVILLTIMLSICALGIFLLIMKPVFLLLYPVEFTPAIAIAYWIAFARVMHGLGDFFNRFLGAHGKGKELRNGAIAVGVINVSGHILLVYLIGVTGAAVTMIISSAVYLSMMVFYYTYHSRKFVFSRNNKL